MFCFLIEAVPLLGVCCERAEVSWVYCEWYINNSYQHYFIVKDENKNNIREHSPVLKYKKLLLSSF